MTYVSGRFVFGTALFVKLDRFLLPDSESIFPRKLRFFGSFATFLTFNIFVIN